MPALALLALQDRGQLEMGVAEGYSQLFCHHFGVKKAAGLALALVAFFQAGGPINLLQQQKEAEGADEGEDQEVRNEDDEWEVFLTERLSYQKDGQTHETYRPSASLATPSAGTAGAVCIFLHQISSGTP